MKSLTIAALLAVTMTPVAKADTADGAALIAMTWDQIVDQARGGTVNWFMWGGSDSINQYVSGYIGGILMADYGITLNRVGLTDTVEAVNIVLGEKQAGVTDKGSVDMIWINGENFRTLRQGDMVWYVAILDARLPDGSGVEVCRQIRSGEPSTKAIILT
ncbi:MAG: hypothetical protein H7173_05475, partial [Rhodoferax sp.]|nr:hypothetical protein [Pseudorhodobacter sp.]